MANRERPRSAPDSGSERRTEPSAFEVGQTTLDLDDISDEELEALYFKDDEPEETSVFNLSTLTGLMLIVVGVVYLLTEIGVWSGTALTGVLGGVLPWLAGIFVILAGFALLTWRSSKGTETDRTKAIDADTGEMKVVEEPTSDQSKQLTRSRTDKKILGVCGGIAEYLGLDPTLVRIAFVVGVIGSGGPFLLAYVGLAFAMPKASSLSPKERLSIIRDDPDDDTQ